MGKRFIVSAVVVSLIFFLFGSFGTYFYINLFLDGNDNTFRIRRNIIPLNEDNSINEEVKKVYDSVVIVEGYNDGVLVSSGTGFIYKMDDEKSYIMTNHHVISDSREVRIILSDGSVLDSSIVGSEVYSDIAVISIDKTDGISVCKTGKSSGLSVGDSLFAIGSPGGEAYAGTVTKGILSSKERLVPVSLGSNNISDYYMKVLQTDVAINPGNSGGPLCNLDGEVIGITNMKLVDSTVEGMGFAIPIEDALEYAKAIEESGEVERPYIGIGMSDIFNGYTLWQAGIDIPDDVNEGIVVISVDADGPAARAGLVKGDIIYELDDVEVNSIALFRYNLYKHKVGDRVEIGYVRDNHKKKVTVTLGSNEN